MSMASFVAGKVSASDFKNAEFCSFREEFDPVPDERLCFTVVVLGASGDLAKKKTYPALFALYSKG